MCNLYSNTMPPDAMRSLFDTLRARDRLGNAEPRPAIFPRGSAPVVRLGDDGAREFVEMEWGFLMPQTSKKTGKPIKPRPVNNARDDKVRGSAFWRASFAARRCLIPATAFCEPKGRSPAIWRWFGVGPAGAARPFAFAGLWRGYEGKWAGRLTHTMLTTTPNPLVGAVHPDRMPAILDPADYETWLTGGVDAAAALLRPWPEDDMHVLGEGEEMKAEPAAAR